MTTKVDPSDPNVRRLVYNMYRGMLGNYNDKANDIISTLPKEMVREDQGIARQLESMIRQSSQLSGGGSTPSPGPPIEGDGVTAPSFAAPPPPPPPPPPPASGPLSSVRLSSEIPDSRKGGGYEPPAAIQNAMMTKDKKPFTYTPGGLDLSQIRSPRMQRRITRNANAEGVGDHPQATVAKTSPLAQPPAQGPLPPSALAAMQPAMPVPVFPTGGGGPSQLHHVTTPPGSNTGPAPPPPPPPTSVPSHIEHPPVANAVPKPAPAVIRPVQSPAPRVEPSTPSPPIAKPTTVPSTTIHNEPGSIYVPPVTPRSQVGSLYIPPINNTQQETVTSPQWQQTPSTASPMSPLPTLNKAPTPWMSQHQKQQQQQNVPSWAVNREEPQPLQQQQQQQSPPQQQSTGTTRIIPIQVEGRNEPAHPPQAQYQPQQQQQQQQQYQQQAASAQPHTRVIPIQIEDSNTTVNSAPKQQPPSQQQQRRPVYVHNKFNPPASPQTPAPPSPAPYNHSAGNDGPSEQNPRQYQHQQSWGPPGGNGGPIQSRSFRVLQKITDTDNSEGESDLQPQQYVPPNVGRGQWNNEGVPVQQMRKLELSEDDRALMNKFRAQVSEDNPSNEEENPRYRGGHIPSRVFRMLDESVDEDSFLHTESDPRYRGAAIPSRAFRLLQNMTDGSGDYNEQVPRGPGVSRGPQTRQVPVQQSPPVDGAAPQAYIPPSEQQVPEPRKYTGGAIPSRSFRMLQAMTAPENCSPGQSDM